MPTTDPEAHGRTQANKQQTELKKNNTKKQEKTVKNGKTKSDKRWLLMVLLITLCISFSIGFITEIIYAVIETSIWRLIVAAILVLIIIIVNITADMLGIAATSADEEPFLAMASKKIKGAKKAVQLCRNADRVSSILNDIIGDVCGIISGASGATIAAVVLSNYTNLELIPTTLISVAVSAVIAAITITGKAIAKRSATTKANEVTFRLAKFLTVFDKDL